MLIPLRGGAGLSRWRLKVDLVKKQGFCRNVAEAMIWTRSHPGGIKASLVNVHKDTEAEREQGPMRFWGGGPSVWKGSVRYRIRLEHTGQSMENPECPHEGLNFALASNGNLEQLINKSKYESLVDIKYSYTVISVK